jgi:hypothetical protein
MLIKADYNQQMCVSSWGTDYSAIKLFVLELGFMKKLLGIVVLCLLLLSTLFFSASADVMGKKNIPITLCDQIYKKLYFGNEDFSEKIDLYSKYVFETIKIDEKNNTFSALLDRHFSYFEPLALDLLKDFDEYDVIKNNLGKESGMFCKYDLNTSLKDGRFRNFQFYYNNIKSLESNSKNWIKIYTSGWVIYSYYDESYTFINNNFDFRKFPFDNQKLSIAQFTDIENFVEFFISKSHKNKILKMNNEKNFNIIVPGWEVQLLEVETIFSTELWKADDSDFVGFIETFINVKRNNFSYIVKYGFPTIFIVLISWGVFWISPQDIKTRAELSIISLLSLIAFNLVINEKLPDLNYLTLLDGLVLTSYLFAGAATILSIVGNVYTRKTKNNKFSIVLDKRARIWGPVSYIIINIVFAYIIINYPL